MRKAFSGVQYAVRFDGSTAQAPSTKAASRKPRSRTIGVAAGAVDDVKRPPFGVLQARLQAIALSVRSGGNELLLQLIHLLLERPRRRGRRAQGASALQSGKERAFGLFRTDAEVRLGLRPEAVPILRGAVGGDVRGIRAF